MDLLGRHPPGGNDTGKSTCSDLESQRLAYVCSTILAFAPENSGSSGYETLWVDEYSRFMCTTVSTPGTHATTILAWSRRSWAALIEQHFDILNPTDTTHPMLPPSEHLGIFGLLISMRSTEYRFLPSQPVPSKRVRHNGIADDDNQALGTVLSLKGWLDEICYAGTK
ncbi:uncharacterized protein CIMG_00180 [Coccidioides immitis RS]|uniref:Uncharacterized protein n=3 Tax=Coccidioides TaxID=5500 RepID=J3KGF9_COCIM|nr:uncharacterized protein CIMG_00180 [Coccidioides immitis RS]EAS34826.3 hypothetical protein CIMG_00180 [Coccidioides immitis RS]EFW18220.1 conserved hypothetical protein [Coccidioides posadasii str. Silveira]KMM66390.1 hypothetical protein CPAG_02729 [Coccidioides posadasii RMSCC 3488]